MENIRWKQRFENYEKAFFQLKKAVETYNEKKLSDLEKQGVIQSFEYTYELAWNLLRDYLIYQGVSDIVGSRDAIKQAFKYGIIKDGEIWIEIINSRNLTTHTYNEKIAESVLKKIVEKYYQEFEKLYKYFKEMVDY